MHVADRSRPARDLLAPTLLLLTAATGLVDAVSFLGGALCGGLLARAMEPIPSRRWLVTTAGGETVLLAAAAVAAVGLPIDASFGRRWPVVALTAVAMGLRNATIRRLNAIDLTTTVLTLTLTGIAADSSLAGGTNPRPLRRVGSVVAMFSGALLGTVLVRHLGLAWPLAIACAAAAVATGVHLLRPLPAIPGSGHRDPTA